jgi:uncharacterized membrane protein AbrB (regulator of aidB expression)
MKKEQLLNILTIVAIIIVIIFVLMVINVTIGMYIDHQCYQLEPNENYISTICERYWK